jgi:hypothetical protein
VSAVRRRYGDGPLHLIAAIASLAITGYAFLEIAGRPAPWSFAIFFAGAIVVHDLIAFPVYAALDRLAGAAASTPRFDHGVINYVRVPALLSGFALIVWFPLILGLDTDRYEAAAGHPPADYLGRWLLLTAVLFAGSGAAYALRRRARARARDPATGPPRPRSRR